MNGKIILLDTNIVLYILANKYNLEELPEGNFCISVITEIELLSYPFLNNKDEKKVKEFLNTIDIIELNKVIKEKTIELKKKYKLKLPDAIICATAYFENAVLVTNDIKLKKVKEVKIL